MTLEKRDYTKKELAIMCNPGMDYNVAYQKYYRDVNNCKPLMTRLRRKGYNPLKHYLSFWQVKLIVKYVYPDLFDV